jgi:hypothetical protein
VHSSTARITTQSTCWLQQGVSIDAKIPKLETADQLQML